MDNDAVQGGAAQGDAAQGPEVAGLPAQTRRVRDRGREVWLVGTAHVSLESIDDVRRTVEAVAPDAICVELCQGRYEAFTRPDAWRKMDVFKVIKEGKAALLLSQLMMSAFYKRVGDRLGVRPGADMLEGVRLAHERDVDLVLADRDVQVTLKRMWRGLNFWNKLKLLSMVVASAVTEPDIDKQAVDDLKKEERLDDVMVEFARAFPAVKHTIIDERDVYLAQKIRETEGERVVAVVGAGHVPGIARAIHTDHELAPMETVPERSRWARSIKWLVPALILAIIAYGFYSAGAAHSLESVSIWVLVNGALAAAGAALALGHPVTVLAAFLAAPVTSLNPTIAAGWVSGLVQAWVKKPTVADLEGMGEVVTAFPKGLWRNPVSRILLVVVFSNLGSTLGTFIGGSWIAARSF